MLELHKSSLLYPCRLCAYYIHLACDETHSSTCTLELKAITPSLLLLCLSGRCLLASLGFRCEFGISDFATLQEKADEANGSLHMFLLVQSSSTIK